MSKSVTRRIQEVLKNILFEFERICDKHGLRYYPIDGTLLGSVRHNGFIPWDDDIDIAMPRPDYEKFCEVVVDELPANMYWISYEESLKGQYFGEIAHLFCKDLEVETDYFEVKRKTHVWLDVMIMYGMPSSKLEQKIFYNYIRCVKGVARMGRIKNIGKRNYSQLERFFIGFAQKIDLSKIIDTEKVLLYCIKVCKKYEYDSAKYVVVLPSEYGFNEVVQKAYYEDVELVRFEDGFIKLPKKYDCILRQLYGDYLQLPPPEKRVSKHLVTIVE